MVPLVAIDGPTEDDIRRMGREAVEDPIIYKFHADLGRSCRRIFEEWLQEQPVELRSELRRLYADPELYEHLVPLPDP